MTMSKQMPMSETLVDEKQDSTMSILDNDNSPMQPVVTIIDKDQRRS